MTPGRYQSSCELAWFRLDAPEPGPAGGQDPVWRLLENLYANAQVAPWEPGALLTDSHVLHIFAAVDHPLPPSGAYTGNSLSDLQAFKSAHPGLEPVLTLRFQDGSPAFHVYDPSLLAGGIDLTSGREVQVRTGAELPQVLSGLEFWGKLERERMAFGEETMQVPFIVPPGGFSALNPGGEGFIRFAPTFANGLDTRQFVPPTNVTKLSGQDCVSCIDGQPCSASFRIGSELPLTRFRLVYYPRGSVSGNNWLRVSYRLDGANSWTTLDTYVPRGPQPWVGDMDGREVCLKPAKPARTIELRFDLSGEGMQLWSAESSPMFLEAQADASALKPLVLRDRVLAVEAQGNGQGHFKMWWSPEPINFHEEWAR